MHHLRPQKPKISGGGGTPRPPGRGCFIQGSFNKYLHTLPSSALHSFRLFGQNPFWSLFQYPQKFRSLTFFCTTAVLKGEILSSPGCLQACTSQTTGAGCLQAICDLFSLWTQCYYLNSHTLQLVLQFNIGSMGEQPAIWPGGNPPMEVTSRLWRTVWRQAE